MLPLMPASPFVRSRKFVAQEWNAIFAGNASTPANKVEGGWQGVLYANLALVDPETSWKYFSRSGFDYGSIDGGATRTWYLAFAAGESFFISFLGHDPLYISIECSGKYSRTIR